MLPQWGTRFVQKWFRPPWVSIRSTHSKQQFPGRSPRLPPAQHTASAITEQEKACCNYEDCMKVSLPVHHLLLLFNEPSPSLKANGFSAPQVDLIGREKVHHLSSMSAALLRDSEKPQENQNKVGKHWITQSYNQQHVRSLLPACFYATRL